MSKKKNPATTAIVTGREQKGEKRGVGCIIPHKEEKVNPSIISAIRETGDVKNQDIVDIVRELFPKFDTTLVTKCDKQEEYGVKLTPIAEKLLRDKYNLHKKKDTHRGKRISCRLSDKYYSAFTAMMRKNGDNQQDFLSVLVIRYLIEMGFATWKDGEEK